MTLTDGRFVVAWEDWSGSGADRSFAGVKAQIFNADGSRSGNEFLVNSTTYYSQGSPKLAALDDGRFIICYFDGSEMGGDASSAGIRAQIYDSNGSPEGTEFLVNTTTAGLQSSPVVTKLANGGFAIAWVDNSRSADDAASYALRAQIFSADGSPSGSEFLVNTTTTGHQMDPALVGLADGKFVAVWTDYSMTAGNQEGADIRAQVFNADGSKFGSEWVVNATIPLPQLQPDIQVLANGNMIVVWQDLSLTGGDASLASIKAQILAPDGTAIGSEILVNTTTDDSQIEPVVAVLPDGRFVIVWQDYSWSGGDTSRYAIRAQVFLEDGTRQGDEFLVNTSTMESQKEPTITVLDENRILIAWSDYSGATGDSSSDAIRGQIFDVTMEGKNIRGDAAINKLLGTDWDDSLAGLGASDQIFAADGDDFLFGGTGADRLFGGSGDDRLFGGAGRDELAGGADLDHFIFASAAHAKGDRIKDFQRNVDKIDVSAFMEGGRYIGSAAFKKGVEDQIRYEKSKGLLSGDLNGDGRADWTLTLVNKAALTVADFLF
ncbi:calcium-binding protein [Neogemmobacter tilapiae]|uniref:calcium-binding protein n=1 Tax=Neogemmobacter tilapiae TaxID=875041 RepID=UPI001674B6E2|nr:M10 family metallopeptidase C-terminal domain-containing protein [Gemmobacter tilapiae]